MKKYPDTYVTVHGGVDNPKTLTLTLPWDAKIEDWKDAFRTILTHQTFSFSTIEELFATEEFCIVQTITTPQKTNTNMHEINWKVGEKYFVKDIMSIHEGELVGFILDQIPVNWKNKKSYGLPDGTIYLVLKFYSEILKKEKFVLAVPNIQNLIFSCQNEGSRSIAGLEGRVYGDDIEAIILKLRKNWVFTPKLTYAATYKENFNPETDLDWRNEN